MELYIGTKEENNKRREEDFLKLPPEERLIAFINMVSRPPLHPRPDSYEHPNDKKNNFILRLNNGI